MSDWIYPIGGALAFGLFWAGLYFVAIYASSEIMRSAQKREDDFYAELERRDAEVIAMWREDHLHLVPYLDESSCGEEGW